MPSSRKLTFREYIIKTLREILTIRINTTSSLFIAENTFLGQSPYNCFLPACFVHRGVLCFSDSCPLLHVHISSYFSAFGWDCFLQISLILTFILTLSTFNLSVFFFFRCSCFPLIRLLFTYILSCRYVSIPREIWGCFKNGFEIDAYGSHHVYFFPACKQSHINMSFTLHKGRYYFCCFLSPPWETEGMKIAVISSKA